MTINIILDCTVKAGFGYITKTTEKINGTDIEDDWERIYMS